MTRTRLIALLVLGTIAAIGHHWAAPETVTLMTEATQIQLNSFA